MTLLGQVSGAMLFAMLAFGPAGAAGLAPPPAVTFPELDPAFSAVREQAFELTKSGTAADVRPLLAEYERLVRDKHGDESREYLDMLIDSAALASLADDVDEALSRSRRAVAIARLNAVSFLAYNSFLDVRVRIEDQQSAFRQFVGLASFFRDRVPDPAALDDEAFRVMQMATLDRTALVWWSRHAAPSLGDDELSQRVRFLFWMADMAEPVRRMAEKAGRLLPDFQAAGLVTPDDIAYANNLIDLVNTLPATIGVPTVELADHALPAISGLAEVKARLGPHDAYVAFFGDENGWMHVFAVTERGHLFVPLDIIAANLFEAVPQLRAHMGVPAARSAVAIAPARDDARMLADAHALYRDLFGPIETIIASRTRLFISADADLVKFPFEALVTRAPDAGTTPASAEWLVRRHAIALLPALPALMSETAAAGGDPPSLLAYADPDYAALAGTDLDRYATADISKLEPLPESASEAQRIAATFGAGRSALRLAGEATEPHLLEDSLSGLMEKADVLLFATHGLLPGETEETLQPSLALTPHPGLRAPNLFGDLPGFIESDGMLTATEISGLKTRARLVILSACNTATGSDRDLEGYSGLARGFLAAGARGVLVTHWPVNSEAAVKLTTGLFAQQSGLVSERLREAALALIAAGGESAHPRYWAPFSYYGDPWTELGVRPAATP